LGAGLGLDRVLRGDYNLDKPTAHRLYLQVSKQPSRGLEVDAMGSSSVSPSSSISSTYRSGVASDDSPSTDQPPGIKRSQGLHDVLFESAPDAMLATDQDGRIREVNAETERQFGYTRQDLIGESIEKLIPVRLREAHRLHREVYQRDPVYRPMDRGYSLFALRKDGREFPVEISLSPVVSETGMLFYCVIRDTSQREAALQELKRHLNLEHALGGLSAKFINLPADCLDQEITSGLQALVESLDHDRAHLGQIDPATGDVVVTHAWCRPGISPFEKRILKDSLPWLEGRIRSGEISVSERPSDLPPEARRERAYMESIGQKSSLVVPFRVAGALAGALAVGSFRQYQRWDDWRICRVRDMADIFANAIARKQVHEELRKAAAEIRALKDKLERENVYLREEIKLQYPNAAIVGNSDSIRSVLKKAEQVAKTDSAVLILGETGTGKELVARTIHEMSRRRQNPMVKINCASLPAALIESELFGREKGAFTGALAREIGRFELADKSTIFLDEIAELPTELQPKLLRVLQEGEFERLGSSKTMRVDVRIIAATNRNLDALIKEGKFREDLFYRLNVFPIIVPPLRERREDILAITSHILDDLAKRMGYTIEGIQTATLREFQKYSWPGNVRELRNVIERNLILHSGPIFRADLPNAGPDKKTNLRRLDEVDTEHLNMVLQSTHWRVRGPGGAAEALGLKPTTLEARMKKLGIRRREEDLQAFGGTPKS
jgi:formate hydrogenlyase transcriptional activator